jgi:hypothetical protein
MWILAAVHRSTDDMFIGSTDDMFIGLILYLIGERDE